MRTGNVLLLFLPQLPQCAVRVRVTAKGRFEILLMRELKAQGILVLESTRLESLPQQAHLCRSMA